MKCLIKKHHQLVKRMKHLLAHSAFVSCKFFFDVVMHFVHVLLQDAWPSVNYSKLKVKNRRDEISI